MIVSHMGCCRRLDQDQLIVCMCSASAAMRQIAMQFFVTLRSSSSPRWASNPLIVAPVPSFTLTGDQRRPIVLNAAAKRFKVPDRSFTHRHFEPRTASKKLISSRSSGDAVSSRYAPIRRMPTESIYNDQASFQDFRSDGYVVINNFLSGSELTVLRQVQILVRQLCKAQQVHSHNHLQGALYRSAMFW